MRNTYHKLVRDRIPEIIQQSGLRCQVATLPPDAFRQALLDKLVEEAQEARQAGSGLAKPASSEPAQVEISSAKTARAEARHALLTELADLLEVVQAIQVAFEISEPQLQQAQSERRQQRGGFDQRLQLLWTDDEQP